MTTITNKTKNRLVKAMARKEEADEIVAALETNPVSDDSYSPSWDGDTTHAPSKNAVFDKIETLTGGSAIDDTAYGPSWDGVTTMAPSKNAIYDKIETLGDGTFAGLSDLESAVVPGIDIFVDTYMNWTTKDPGNANNIAGLFSDTGDGANQAGFFAGSGSAQATVYGYLDGTGSYLIEQGAKEVFSKNYSTETALDKGYSIHQWTSDPGADIVIDRVTDKNDFYILNASGATLTIAANSGETFNGSSTIDLSDGKGYHFLTVRNGSAYYVSEYNVGAPSSNVISYPPTVGGDVNSVTVNDGEIDHFINTSFGQSDIYQGVFEDDAAYCEISAIYGSNTARVSATVDSNGFPKLELEGTYKFTVRSYSNFTGTELIYGRIFHHFIGDVPTNDVEVDSSKTGDFFYIINSTSGIVTLVPKSGETFNDDTSYDILPGKTIQIVKGTTLHVNELSDPSQPRELVDTDGSLALQDRNNLIIMNSSDPHDLQIHPDSTTPYYKIGTKIDVIQMGSGQVTLAPQIGATVNAIVGLKISAQYGRVTLTKVAADTWVASGDLSA